MLMKEATSRKLLLLRHAQASHQRRYADTDRPLTDLGVSQTKQMAEVLITREQPIDALWVSPAKRTVQTAHLLSQRYGLTTQQIFLESAIYLANAQQLLTLLRQVPEQLNQVMLVGHNPGLTALLQALTPPQSKRHSMELSPASLAILQVEKSWQQLGDQPATLELLIHAR